MSDSTRFFVEERLLRAVEPERRQISDPGSRLQEQRAEGLDRTAGHKALIRVLKMPVPSAFFGP